MAKKILKRSLALGVLMAFVITGSAMAKEVDYTTFVEGANNNVISVTEDTVVIAGDSAQSLHRYTLNVGDGVNLTLNEISSAAGYAGGVKNVTGKGNVTIINKKPGVALDSGGTINVKNLSVTSNDNNTATRNDSAKKGGSTTIVATEDVYFHTGDHAIHTEGGKVVIDARNVTIETESDDKGRSIINSNGGSVDINATGDVKINSSILNFAGSKNGTITIDAKNITVDSYIDGVLNEANGVVALKASNDLTIKVKEGKDALYLNGDYEAGKIELAAGGKTVVEGDVANLGAGVINASFNGEGSYLKGAAVNSDAGEINFTFNNGAIWNMTGDSNVTKIEGVVNVQGEGKTLKVNALVNKVVKDSQPIGDINVGKLYVESNGNAISSYGDLAITADEVELKADSNGIYLEDSGSEVTLNTNKLTIDADGNGINVNKPYDKLEITGTGENSIVTINAGGNGIITRDGYDVSGGHNESVIVKADIVNITSTGKDEITRYDKGNAILSQGKDSNITVDGGTVNIISGKDGVTALKGGNAIVTGNNIKIDVDSADNYDSYVYGVHAGERSIGNGSVTIGDENTTSVIIDVNGKDANGIFARAYNNSGKAEDQSSVVVKGAKLDITVDGTGDGIAGVWAASGTESKNAPSSIVTLETADTKISATNGIGIVSYSNGTVDVKGNLDIDAKYAIQTRGYAKTFINVTKDKTVTIDGDIAFTKEYDQDNVITDAEVVLNLSNDKSYLEGNIYVDNFDSVVNNKATYKDITGMALGISNGAYWATQAGAGAVDNFVNDLTMYNGTIKHNNEGNITVNNYSGNGIVELNTNGHIHIDKGTGSLNLTNKDLTAESINGLSEKEVADKFNAVAAKLGVKDEAKDIKASVVVAEGDVTGETTGDIVYSETDEHEYYHGTVTNVTEKVNTKNQAIGEAGVSLKLHWRSHMNDMNKRMGELRNAEGEHGVWARMVRGESEYKNTKAQYNQYQLGYDEKLSVDKRWTVGAAVTFAEGDANYGQGSTDDKSTAFAIYGSKLNNDGTFVDLIARYAHLESDLDDANSGKGDYATNGMSVSAEFGKRIQQGDGLWVEPQVELTYGTIDSAEFKFDGGKAVQVGDMDSLIGRVGFRIGKDLEQGNVYARASYLYDFDGETENAFSKGDVSRTIAEDLGGGWWEVGVGANINLSKATYVYADVEKTFGGEVDTNWQWNLGVRYSF